MNATLKFSHGNLDITATYNPKDGFIASAQGKANTAIEEWLVNEYERVPGYHPSIEARLTAMASRNNIALTLPPQAAELPESGADAVY